MRGWVAGLAVVAATAACVGDWREAPSFAVSDSVGVEIVVTAVPTWDGGGGWTVDTAASVRIGMAEGDAPYLFEDIIGVVSLDDGGIAIGDGLTKEIRFFDARGAHARTVGGAGQGPQEFQYLAWLGLCGEGLYVFDYVRHRVSVWSQEGEYEETFQLREPGSERMPYQSGCGPKGNLVVTGWGKPRGSKRGLAFELYKQEAPLWLIDRSTGTTEEVGQYISSERVFTTNPITGGTGHWQHPFGRGVVFTLDGQHLFVGSSERLQIEVRDFGGRLLSILRGPDVDLSITDADIEQYRSLSFARPDSILRRRLEEQDMPMPPAKPAYTKFLVDPAGNLWVKRFALNSMQPEQWGVFSAAGRFYGHVEMPEGFRLANVTADQVIGVAEDDVGVERVEMRRLNRSGEFTAQTGR